MPSARQSEPTRNATLILEELSPNLPASEDRIVPTTSNPTKYIEAHDTRIGALYQPHAKSGIGSNMQACVEAYRGYLLGTFDIDSRPIPETAHPSLSARIRALRERSSMPFSTRIGIPDVDGSNRIALLPILAMTEQGYAVGELECRRDSSVQWYLYNFVLGIVSSNIDNAHGAPPLIPLF